MTRTDIVSTVVTMAQDDKLTMRIDPKLKAWAKKYAEKQEITVTQLITEHLRALKAEEDKTKCTLEYYGD